MEIVKGCPTCEWLEFEMSKAPLALGVLNRFQGALQGHLRFYHKEVPGPASTPSGSDSWSGRPSQP